MNNSDVLSSAFSQVYSRQFKSSSFDDRLEMQKMAFLMKELGTSCGDYSFVWYKYGPYSQELQNDIIRLTCDSDGEIVFTPKAIHNMERIREILNVQHNNYTCAYWIEAIASVYYLRKYIYPFLEKNDVLVKLKALKTYLEDDQLNDLAYNISTKLLSEGE